MKYYSEITEKLYNTEKELKEAESEKKAELDALEEKRKEKERRRQEIEDAYERAEIATKEADNLVKAFERDYGENYISIEIPEKCESCKCPGDCKKHECENGCNGKIECHFPEEMRSALSVLFDI